MKFKKIYNYTWKPICEKLIVAKDLNNHMSKNNNYYYYE